MPLPPKGTLHAITGTPPDQTIPIEKLWALKDRPDEIGIKATRALNFQGVKTGPRPKRTETNMATKPKTKKSKSKKASKAKKPVAKKKAAHKNGRKTKSYLLSAADRKLVRELLALVRHKTKAKAKTKKAAHKAKKTGVKAVSVSSRTRQLKCPVCHKGPFKFPAGVRKHFRSKTGKKHHKALLGTSISFTEVFGHIGKKKKRKAPKKSKAKKAKTKAAKKTKKRAKPGRMSLSAYRRKHGTKKALAKRAKSRVTNPFGFFRNIQKKSLMARARYDVGSPLARYNAARKAGRVAPSAPEKSLSVAERIAALRARYADRPDLYAKLAEMKRKPGRQADLEAAFGGARPVKREAVVKARDIESEAVKFRRYLDELQANPKTSINDISIAATKRELRRLDEAHKRTLRQAGERKAK